MHKFLRDRRSYREFRNKKASQDTLNKISKCIDEILEEARDVNIGLALHSDGDKVFNELKNIGGYAGVMIDSPHYISLQFKDDLEYTEIYGGYFTEKLKTKLNVHGLEACWVTLTDVEKTDKIRALGDVGEHTDYVLAIGYPPRKNPFTRDVAVSERMGVEEIVFQDVVENPIDMTWLDDRSLDDLFYYVRFAPSKRNSQPWRFLLKNNKVKLLMAHTKEEGISAIDAGVIMYYFEEMAKSIGINHEWEIIEGSCEGETADYKYIAEFEI